MKLIKTGLVFLLALSLFAFRPDSDIPHRISMDPGTAGGGDTVTFTVELNQNASQNTTVTIGSASTFWSSIPSQVVVPQGETSVDFQATLATSPTGSNRVTASANGVSKFFDVPL